MLCSTGVLSTRMSLRESFKPTSTERPSKTPSNQLAIQSPSKTIKITSKLVNRKLSSLNQKLEPVEKKYQTEAAIAETSNHNN